MPSFISSTPTPSQPRAGRSHSSDPPRLFPPSSTRRRLSLSQPADSASTAIPSDDFDRLRDLCRRAGANVTLAITDENEREREEHLNAALDVLRRMERILGLYDESGRAGDGVGAGQGRRMGGGGPDGVVEHGTGVAHNNGFDAADSSDNETSTEEEGSDGKHDSQRAAETNGHAFETPADTATAELEAAQDSEEVSRRRRDEVRQFAARMQELEREAQQLDAGLRMDVRARAGLGRD